MKIKGSQQIFQRDGSPFVNESGEPWTVSAVCLAALDAGIPGDEKKTVKERRQLAELGDRIFDANGEFELSETEVETIIERVSAIISSARMVNEIFKALN